MLLVIIKANFKTVCFQIVSNLYYKLLNRHCMCLEKRETERERVIQSGFSTDELKRCKDQKHAV